MASCAAGYRKNQNRTHSSASEAHTHTHITHEKESVRRGGIKAAPLSSTSDPHVEYESH